MIFRSISVGGHPAVEVCLRTDGGDPVVPWLLEHDWIDEPVMRLFGDLVRPGMRVLDLGAHLGLFGLTAARLGAEVLAVDGVQEQVERLRAAAARNGFEGLTVAHGALAARSGDTVRFLLLNPHSHVVHHPREEELWTAADVETVTVDDLLEERGWDAVDLVKLDIEGSEPPALRGMARLFARGCRPVFLFEANAGALLPYGHDVARLRAFFTRRGYRLLQVDHLHPGVLVDAPRVQAECVVDYLALPPGQEPPDTWDVGAATREQTVTRLLDEATIDFATQRHFVAGVLDGAPAWLASDPLVAPARRALAEDLVREVRDRLERPRPARWRTADEPPDPDVVILAREVAVSTEREALARAPGQPRETPRPTRARGVSLHVRRGTFVGIVGDDAGARAAVMAALAGRADVAEGTLEVREPSLALGSVAEVLEPELSFAENVVIAAAFLGQATGGRADPLAERLGVFDSRHEPLQWHSADIALCLVLALLLEARGPELLLLDRLALPRHAELRDWAWHRCRELCGQGVTIVQSAETAETLLGPPTRLAYLRGEELIATGHPGSIADLARRHALGLPDHVAAEHRRPLSVVA